MQDYHERCGLHWLWCWEDTVACSTGELDLDRAHEAVEAVVANGDATDQDNRQKRPSS
jgi:hypothetical protein